MSTGTEGANVDSTVLTGFHDLDDLIGGLRGGQIIVIAGRPAMGKNTMAMNIINNVYLESKQSVYVLSLKMSSKTDMRKNAELIIAKHPTIPVPIIILLSYDPKEGGFRCPEVRHEK